MYIESLQVQNFKCFEKAEAQFQFPGRCPEGSPDAPRLPNVNLLLGDNGSGKSAVLKAIALGVLAPILPSSGFRPYMLVRQKKEMPLDILAHAASLLILHEAEQIEEHEAKYKAEVYIRRRGNTEQLTDLNDLFGAEPTLYGNQVTALYEDNSPGFFLVGYGATRRVGNIENFDSGARERSRSPRYQRVAGLFEDYIALTPPEIWRIDNSLFNRGYHVGALFNKLLPDELRIRFMEVRRPTRVFKDLVEFEIVEEVKAHLLFMMRRMDFPFDILSDGYRGFIGWVGDLLYQLNRVAPPDVPLTEIRGVVMVDEVDLLLHPTWQRVVIEKVATTFPNLQFFFTSHSPLVAGTLEAANIYVTEPTESDSDNPNAPMIIVPGQERIYGRSADQILTSSYFGLTSPRAPGTQDIMRTLARKAWEGDPDASLKFLEKLAVGFGPPDEGRTTESDSAPEKVNTPE